MRMRPPSRLLPTLIVCTLAGGCYHYSIEQRPPGTATAHTLTFSERRPTYLNGFIGTGRMDATKYCDSPVRTELRVTAIDVLLGFFTLLIYTPHTLYVTCNRADAKVSTPAD